MSTLMRKMYRVNANSPVAKLVESIEQQTAERGLTVSRWQTNSKAHGFVDHITWTIHTGPRAVQARYQKNIVSSIVLHQIEGNTENCRAYRQLSRLLKAIQ